MADKMLSITGSPITDVKATELKATEVWMEVCVTFQDSTTMKFKDILGEGIADKILSITGHPITDVKATELKATEVWMEVCVTPSLARYKLFQLFRAHLYLSPKKRGKRVIGVICLNGEYGC